MGHLQQTCRQLGPKEPGTFYRFINLESYPILNCATHLLDQEDTRGPKGMQDGKHIIYKHNYKQWIEKYFLEIRKDLDTDLSYLYWIREL